MKFSPPYFVLFNRETLSGLTSNTMTKLKERLSVHNAAIAANVLMRKGMSEKGALSMALKYCCLKNDLKKHLHFALYGNTWGF